MNRTLKVAKFEFLVNFKRIEFLLATFGIPLIFAILIGLAGLLSFFLLKQQSSEVETRYWGLVDNSGLLHLRQKEIETEDLEGHLTCFTIYESKEEALTCLNSEKIEKLYVIKKDFLASGETDHYYKKLNFIRRNSHQPLNDLVIERLLKDEVNQDVVERMKQLMKINNFDHQGKPVKALHHFAPDMVIPYMFFYMLFLSLTYSSGYLIRGLAGEKENKIMEILLTSCRPQELFAGKILGLGLLGLVQLAVWLAIGIPAVVYFFPLLRINLSLIVIMLVFFLLNYLLYSSIAAGLGSLGSSEKESVQITSWLLMIQLVPIFFLEIIRGAPHGTVAKVLSYIPFTSPVIIVIRSAIDKVPLAEIILAMAIMTLAIYFVIVLSVKIFRLGILMYGKRPGMREIWRWLKET